MNQSPPQILSTLNPQQLELILFPTEQCNFRCTYCYEEFLLGEMKKDIQLGIKALLLKRMKSINALQLSWFGGEPLAAKKIIYELCEFAYSLCAQNQIIFSGSVTTNGYLLDQATAYRLCSLNQKHFQISLDGYGDGHDQTRRLGSGAGTFNKIWANLMTLHQSDIDFSILLRIHLTPDNLASVKKLSFELKKHLLNDKRFSVFIKPIENLGGPNRQQIVPLSKTTRVDAVREIKNLLGMEETQTTSSAGSLVKVCYASRPNSLVIRADGRIQKCTVALNAEHNTVGQLCSDGTISLDEKKMHGWMRGYVTSNSDELVCPAQNFPTKHKKVIPISST